MNHRTKRPLARRLLGVASISIFGLTAAGQVGSAANVSASSDERTIVIFGVNPEGDGYLTKLFAGFEEEAANRNITLEQVLNPQDQTVMNNQILQYLNTNTDMPDAFIWMPTTQEAGLGALRRLADTGVPVFLSNRSPEEEVLPYIKFYTGTDFAYNGQVSTEAIIAARDELMARDALHSELGNLVLISWPESYTISAVKLAGVQSGLEETPMDVVDIQYAPSPDQNGGFAAMNTAISRVGDDGIDVVYAFNDGMLDGAIQALTAAGFSPGEDVMAVGGNCWGNFEPLISGTQFSTMIVGGVLEGRYMITTVDQYLDNPEVQPGSFTAPDTADEFPELPETPYEMNLLPQPAMIVGGGTPEENQETIDAFRLWGVPAQELCT